MKKNKFLIRVSALMLIAAMTFSACGGTPDTPDPDGDSGTTQPGGDGGDNNGGDDNDDGGDGGDGGDIETPDGEIIVPIEFAGEILDKGSGVMTKTAGNDLYYVQAISLSTTEGSMPYAHGLFDNVDNLKISLDKDKEYMFYVTMIVDGKNKIGKNYDGIYGKPFMSSLTNKFVKEQTFDTYYIWNGGTDMADGSYYTRPATDRYFGLTDAYDPDSKTPSPVVINTVRGVFGVNVKVKNLSEGEVSVALLESPPFIITASRPEASGLFTLSDLKEAFFTDAFGKTDITNEYCEDINVVVMQEVDGKDTPVVYEEVSFRRNMMNNIEITIPEIGEGKIQVSVEDAEMEDDLQGEIGFTGGGSVIKK